MLDLLLVDFGIASRRIGYRKVADQKIRILI